MILLNVILHEASSSELAPVLLKNATGRISTRWPKLDTNPKLLYSFKHDPFNNCLRSILWPIFLFPFYLCQKITAFSYEVLTKLSCVFLGQLEMKIIEPQLVVIKRDSSTCKLHNRNIKFKHVQEFNYLVKVVTENLSAY